MLIKVAIIIAKSLTGHRAHIHTIGNSFNNNLFNSIYCVLLKYICQRKLNNIINNNNSTHINIILNTQRQTHFNSIRKVLAFNGFHMHKMYSLFRLSCPVEFGWTVESVITCVYYVQ